MRHYWIVTDCDYGTERHGYLAKVYQMSEEDDLIAFMQGLSKRTFAANAFTTKRAAEAVEAAWNKQHHANGDALFQAQPRTTTQQEVHNA